MSNDKQTFKQAESVMDLSMEKLQTHATETVPPGEIRDKWVEEGINPEHVMALASALTHEILPEALQKLQQVAEGLEVDDSTVIGTLRGVVESYYEITKMQTLKKRMQNADPAEMLGILSQIVDGLAKKTGAKSALESTKHDVAEGQKPVSEEEVKH